MSVRSSLIADCQSFNTRTIGRSPVGRSHAHAYGMVAALLFRFMTLHVDGSEQNYLAVSCSTIFFSASMSAFS